MARCTPASGLHMRCVCLMLRNIPGQLRPDDALSPGTWGCSVSAKDATSETRCRSRYSAPLWFGGSIPSSSARNALPSARKCVTRGIVDSVLIGTAACSTGIVATVSFFVLPQKSESPCLSADFGLIARNRLQTWRDQPRPAPAGSRGSDTNVPSGALT